MTATKTLSSQTECRQHPSEGPRSLPVLHHRTGSPYQATAQPLPRKLHPPEVHGCKRLGDVYGCDGIPKPSILPHLLAAGRGAYPECDRHGEGPWRQVHEGIKSLHTSSIQFFVAEGCHLFGWRFDLGDNS